MTRARDDMLVQACLRGDRHAFDELVDRYQGPLFNAAYRITGSIDDAMDATQSAFVKAYEKLDSFDPARRFFSWIYRIAINESLNLVGRRKAVTGLDVEMTAETASPEEACARSEAGGFLHRALMDLDPEQRALIVLKHLGGFSCREIGELLEVPDKTVKSRLFSARRRLREVLAEEGFVP